MTFHRFSRPQRLPMLDELDQQEYFTTVLLDGHNGEYDLSGPSDDAFAGVRRAAEMALYPEAVGGEPAYVIAA